MFHTLPHKAYVNDAALIAANLRVEAYATFIKAARAFAALPGATHYLALERAALALQTARFPDAAPVMRAGTAAAASPLR